MINLFLPNKKTLIFGAILGIFILVLALITLLSAPAEPPGPGPSPISSRKPVPTPILPTPVEKPLLEPKTTTSFPQIFEKDSVEKNYQRIINKQPLTANEQEIKSRLLQTTRGESGLIDETDLFRVEYLKSADYFMVQITNNQVVQAKKSATGWFLDQGFSQEGVCNLPVVLYLTTNVRDYLEQNNLKFSPIPEGCQ